VARERPEEQKKLLGPEEQKNEVNTMDYVKLNKQNDTISSYKRKGTFKNRK
jgi:hypothetical protein